MEGLVVDKGITLGDLQGALNTFVQKLFGADTRTRLRPSYFPFTDRFPKGTQGFFFYVTALSKFS